MVEMTVAAANSGATGADEQGSPLGLTLKQTLAYDENDENLLRYPVKKDELQAVLPGHAVPILTRGLVLLKSTAFKTDSAPNVGDFLVMSDTAGKLEGLADPGASVEVGKILGKCIATDGGSKRLCKVSF